jgi:hypothetical protein
MYTLRRERGLMTRAVTQRTRRVTVTVSQRMAQLSVTHSVPPLGSRQAARVCSACVQRVQGKQRVCAACARQAARVCSVCKASSACVQRVEGKQRVCAACARQAARVCSV